MTEAETAVVMEEAVVEMAEATAEGRRASFFIHLPFRDTGNRHVGFNCEVATSALSDTPCSYQE